MNRKHKKDKIKFQVHQADLQGNMHVFIWFGENNIVLQLCIIVPQIVSISRKGCIMHGTLGIGYAYRWYSHPYTLTAVQFGESPVQWGITRVALVHCSQVIVVWFECILPTVISRDAHIWNAGCWNSWITSSVTGMVVSRCLVVYDR